MLQFLGILALIAFAVSIPLFVMWAQGQFVGQKPAPAWAKALVTLVVAGALIFAFVMFITALRHEDGVRKWIMLAWIFGSGIAALASLLQGMEAKKDIAKPE